MRKLTLKLLLLVVLAGVPALLANEKASAAWCCTTCTEAVQNDPSLCDQLAQIATKKCGIVWIIDPCSINPEDICQIGQECRAVCNPNC